MRIRDLLPLFAFLLLLPGERVRAQQPAPAPPTPPATTAPPAPPAEPQTFTFYYDGSNYLGILPEDINDANMGRYSLSEPRGVGISRVTQGSPAERAGLKTGDVILQYDGEPVTSVRKLFRLIGESAPEHTARLTIRRGGSEQQVSVKLGVRENAARTLEGLMPRQRELFNQPPRPYVLPPSAPLLNLRSSRRIGVTTTDLTAQLADYFGVAGRQGLLITSVREDSPAAKAGLRAGDIVTEVDGQKVGGAGDFVRALNRQEQGDVTLTVIRDKSQRTLRVTPERRAEQGFDFPEFRAAPLIGALTLPQINMQIPALRLEGLGRSTQLLPATNLNLLLLRGRLLSIPNVRTLSPLPCLPF
ncbi:MAG TPA: PDZ domain-containing protein [Pyrinomonadaceae bacterium]|jgi:serine protease Do